MSTRLNDFSKGHKIVIQQRLHEADHLHTERIDDLSPDSGTGTVTVTLPQPGVVRIRLVDGDAPSATDEETTR